MLKHSTYIAGVKFRPGAADYLAKLGNCDSLTLVPEPTNQFDPHAVQVMHGPMHLGYVPRDLSAEVSRLIADGRIHAVRRIAASLVIEYREAVSP